ncbi:MAG: Flp pilus assembly complex ATPase component TadA, partial [Elusimicrobia bacterium]|nr:Flp pilus assembly complex ATPase component TadA [Elusimicrobiota bacterium]
MKLSEICIKRPVFATMLVMALVVLGLFSYPRLGLDLFPNIEFPFVVVTTVLPGAGPEEVETSVTKPIEEAVNTISGIENLKSTSFEGLSQILIQFVLEKNAAVAAQEVQDKVNLILRDLPQGTDPPVVEKFDPGAIPIMSVAVYGSKSLIELTQITKKKVKENIETVNGVGTVQVVGGREREIHVVVNPLKLSALNLSIKQVKDALREQNIEIPGGRVENGRREWVLRTLGRIRSASDFEKVVVTEINGVPVRIADIGRVEDTGQEMRTFARLDGRQCVSLVILKQSGTNTVEVVKQVKKRLSEITPLLPDGVLLEVIRDQSSFIEKSVATVEEHIVLGGVFAALIVLLFMGNLRATLIAAVAIPSSIIATFTLMDMAGFTLNNMTLLALTIAVGIVIDDAIVVLENIFRYMDELGKPAIQAAVEGTKEIGLAVMATTMSLLVIFIPLAYMSGIVGRFLKSYGLTTAFAIAVSLLVAFTLTPMLASRFLKSHRSKSKTRALEIADKINAFLTAYYELALRWALSRRKTMVIISVVTILTALPLIKFIGKDFLPNDDQSQFQVHVKAPEGTSIQVMAGILAQLETEVRRLPQIKHLLASVGEVQGSGVNEGGIYVRLAEQEDRNISQRELMIACRKLLSKYNGLRISVQEVGMIGGGTIKESELSYIIKGPDLDKLREYSDFVKNELKRPNGMILNTGPTGSGKTTTLYAFLKHKKSPEIKIITIEDPIEYHLEGIEQTQVDEEAGYTFENGLRSLMRQDPDAILVGEMRDKETAEIGIQAALTGHLVFSTLHTNNASGAIPRLLDLGVKSTSIGPALNLIIDQRLVRRLCQNCKIAQEAGEDLKDKIRKFLDSIPKRVNIDNFKEIKIFKPVGCEKCNGTGY